MRCGHIDVSPDQCDGQSAKPQISVTQPATVTACACGWPRVFAMCPGSQPAMQNTAITLATRMKRTIQAKMSRPDMEKTFPKYKPEPCCLLFSLAAALPAASMNRRAPQPSASKDASAR